MVPFCSAIVTTPPCSTGFPFCHAAQHPQPRPGGAGTRRLHDLLASESRLSATAIQTVGVKGYDGFAVALVIADP